jgi:hypothetical protein
MSPPKRGSVLSRIAAAAAAVSVLFAICAGSATASVISLTHATDPFTVTASLVGNPNCSGFGSSSILQTFEPADFGVSGPFRITGLYLPWSGGLFAALIATDSPYPGGNPVMTVSLGSYTSTDYSTVQGVFGGIGATIVPAGSHLTVRVVLDNAPGFFPPPIWGLNLAPSDGITSWYSDCQTPLRPLSDVTNATLPLTLTVIPLSRDDLSGQAQQLVTTLNGISPGEVTSLSQQALNGSLNDFINHLDALNKMQGSSIYDYLINYAQLLLGASNIGYPCCYEFPF